MKANCVLCGAVTDEAAFRLGKSVECTGCGFYILPGTVAAELADAPAWLRYELAHAASFHRGQNMPLEISEDVAVAPKYGGYRQSAVSVRRDRVLQWIGRALELEVRERGFRFAEWACAGAYGERDLFGLVRTLAADGLVRSRSPSDPLNTGALRDQFVPELTGSGWREYEGLSKGQGSEQGFVAMWFNAETAKLRPVVLKAIKDAGYKPLVIDMKEHNERIDDQIMVEIRRSRFVVADFTGHRGGVYFEAGFAKGLGKDVVWTVRDTDMDGLHFDTRQFNHLKWSADNLPEFGKALRWRILNTVGAGPHIDKPR